MRKLVSVQAVKDVQPIKGADAIEKIRVLGWTVVVKKDEFKVGDKLVYAEIDSLFPNKPEFDFLKNSGHRIRTVKLRGQISQGICFPLNILPPGAYELNQDVTDIIGVTKYEHPDAHDDLSDIKGTFPPFLSSTKETRVQNAEDQLNVLVGKDTIATEKLDGKSTTFYLNDDVFGVCSHHVEMKNNGNVFWRMAKHYKIEEKLRFLGRNIALHGETVGEGISGNKYGIKGNQFFLFNAFDIDTFEYLPFNELMTLAIQLDIDLVPIIHKDLKLSNDVDGLVDLSKGKSILNPKIKREGLVLIVNDNSLSERVSFKVINPDFLLKYKDE